MFCGLSTGLRRVELVGLDLDQVEPARPEDLRAAKRARLARVRGMGGTCGNSPLAPVVDVATPAAAAGGWPVGTS